MFAERNKKSKQNKNIFLEMDIHIDSENEMGI